MIRTEGGGAPAGTFTFAARNAAELSRELKPGSVVRVSVLAAMPDGTMRVSIGGRSLIAAGVKNLAAGSSFDAKISISGNTVLVSPVVEKITSEIPGYFSSLGLPETPISGFLVSFFRSINMKLDADTIRSIMKAAARFPGRETRAAEAAAILSERGIACDDETVARMIDLLEGKAGFTGADAGGDAGCDAGGQGERERSFCAFVNQKKGQDLHWFVIPFRQIFEGRPCSGSIRFLLDTIEKKTAETRVTFLDGAHCWEFTVRGKACTFTSKPGFPSVVFDKFVVYLKRLLMDSGIDTVSWHDPGETPGSVIKSIDVEI